MIRLILGIMLGLWLGFTLSESKVLNCDREFLDDVPYGTLYYCKNNGKLLSTAR